MPENKDPNHKWHERLPNDLGGLSTEIVVSVDIPLTTHGPNLEDLVQWVHWQLTVDSWHIRRHPEYEDHQVALLQHHPEWSLSGAEIPTGVVNDKSHHVRLWFEHSVDWLTIHPWQKLHPKWVWEPPSHYFGLYLLLKKFLFLFGLQQMPQFMPQFWISSLHCVSKWPETLAESDEDRVNKRAILVVSEQSLKYALGSPAALLKTCQTSRNLNFLNWSSNTLLTDPDPQWITLSRLRM